MIVSPGIALGSLCAIGTEPRAVTAFELETLKRLAAVVTGLIRGHGTAQDAARLAADAQAQKMTVEDQARELRLRERRFLQTERIARLGGWELDLSTNLVTWSDETYRIHEMTTRQSLDLPVAMSSYPEAERSRLEAAITRTVQHSTGFDDEFEIDTGSGPRKWVRVVGEVEAIDGVPRRLFGTVQDISERRRAQAILWNAANRDSLTGLANRNNFDELLGPACANADVSPAMLMIDADHLKEVNDTLGHDAGDELIRTIALRLRVAVGPVGSIARLGGDEFAVLIPGPVDAEALDKIAAEILGTMQPPHVFKGNTLKPRVSIGGALGKAGIGPQPLRQSADLALYHAKSHRRGGYVFYHDDLKCAITARITAVNTIDEAISAGDVLAWYQPVVDLGTGEVTSLEALARVRQNGVIHSIGAFADALDDRRTAMRLTACVLGRIEADVQTFNAAGIELPRIALNVGALDFVEGTIEPLLTAAFARGILDPEHLTLEVTESVFLSREAGVVSETAARLKALGVVVALDDFGTGHASLAHLGTFPVDVIKMDRSFVMRMEDGSGAIIAAALIDLAHKLEIQVIAEGVETDMQADRLRRLGCEKAQGFLFSPALAPDEVPAFVKGFQPLPLQLKPGRRVHQLAMNLHGDESRRIRA